jgi:hypothetical protein
VLRRSVRICEECGTERRITLLEQAVTTSDGRMVTGLFGEGRCLCPSYALDALDLEALDATRRKDSESEEDDEPEEPDELEEIDS